LLVLSFNKAPRYSARELLYLELRTSNL